MQRQGCHLYIFAASADKLRVHGTGRCTFASIRIYAVICNTFISICMYIYLYEEHIIYIHIFICNIISAFISSHVTPTNTQKKNYMLVCKYVCEYTGKYENIETPSPSFTLRIQTVWYGARRWRLREEKMFPQGKSSCRHNDCVMKSSVLSFVDVPHIQYTYICIGTIRVPIYII